MELNGDPPIGLILINPSFAPKQLILNPLNSEISAFASTTPLTKTVKETEEPKQGVP